MKRRKEWFEHMREAYTVLWWVPEGHRPTAAEAKSRLYQLRELGPSPDAFTFKQPFASPDKQRAGLLSGFDDTCPATQQADRADAVTYWYQGFSSMARAAHRRR